MGLRFLLVGCGARAQYWDEVICSSNNATIEAYVDANLSHAEVMADRRGRQAFDEMTEALRNVSVDAVIISTPPSTHERLIRTSIRHGLHTLAEKPLTDDIDTALALVEEAERKGVTLTMSVQYRYLPVSKEIRRLLADGHFGRPGFGAFHYMRNRDPHAAHLNWGTKYPMKVRHPMLVDQTIHHYDLIRYCYQSEPIWLQAHTWNPHWSPYAHDSNVATTMELSNGIIVEYLGTWTGGWDQLQFEWRTDCDGGIVTQRSLFGDLFAARKHQETLEAIPLDPFTPNRDDSRILLQEFVNSIRDGSPAPCSGRDHLHTLAMVFAAIESTERKARIDMVEFRRSHRLPAL